MTLAEALLWQKLRRNQLQGMHFRRQQVIDGFIADFYCHAAAVVVELDGSIHEHQTETDAERDTVFDKRGMLVLRFTNEQVFCELHDVLRRIIQVCVERIANKSNSPFPLREGG
jgi:very-short-patch-repair endonuclease